MNVIAAKSIYNDNCDNRAMKIVEPFLLQVKDKPTYADNRGKVVQSQRKFADGKTSPRRQAQHASVQP